MRLIILFTYIEYNKYHMIHINLITRAYIKLNYRLTLLNESNILSLHVHIPKSSLRFLKSGKRLSYRVLL